MFRHFKSNSPAQLLLRIVPCMLAKFPFQKTQHYTITSVIFHDKDREIKDQMVQKCPSDRLRRKALREDPTLDNLIADRQAKTMEDANVMRVCTKS